MADLSRIPGLAGFIAQRQNAQAEEAQTLQNAAGVLNLQHALEKQARIREQAQREAAARADYMQLPPDAGIDAYMGVAKKHLGGEALLKMGLDLYQTREAAKQRAAQQQQLLDFRRDDLERRREEFSQRQADAAQRAAFDQAYRQQSLALQRAQGEMNAELRRLGIQAQAARVEDTRDRNLDRQVTGFANQLQQTKLPNLGASIVNLNNLLKKYENASDIPGVGTIEGSSLIPGFLRSSEGANVKSAIQGVANDLLQLYSGAAVTLPEAERRELEMMVGGAFSEQNLKDAWPRLVSRFNATVGNLSAGVSDTVRSEYGSRPGAMSLQPLVPTFGVQDQSPAGLPSQSDIDAEIARRRAARGG